MKKIRMTLEDYFREGYEKGIIDYSLRASSDEGGFSFYIHAQNLDSETLDFEVEGNELKPNSKITYMED